MNTLDIGILLLILLCAFVGYRRGLIRGIYRIISFAIAIAFAYMLFPYAARALRRTPLFSSIQERVAYAINLDGFFNSQVATYGAALIDSLQLPPIFHSLLHSNNTPAMFELLRVSTMEEYITGFFASMAINALSIIMVFILTLIVLNIVSYGLNLFDRIPVIRTLNRIGGFIFGLVFGVLLVWVGVFVATFFIVGINSEIMEFLDQSIIVSWLLDATLPVLSDVS